MLNDSKACLLHYMITFWCQNQGPFYFAFIMKWAFGHHDIIFFKSGSFKHLPGETYSELTEGIIDNILPGNSLI